MNNQNPYHEIHRPQFHFTPKRDWMNDPNGLVYYKGEYHLFFQHTPGSVRHGPNTWGHAISNNLVHWQQIDHALEPDEMGWIWSGSAVVDRHNSAGFEASGEQTLVAFYTVGDTRSTPPKPCVQCVAFSTNRGRTWLKYVENPVIGHIRAHNRDPKVIWHEPSSQWVMALYLDANDYTLFRSTNLRQWSRSCDITLAGVSECPDIFELPVDANPYNTRWVFWGGNGGYLLGNFDGHTFTPETDVLYAEQGLNGYAAQTWSDILPEDGRRIQISWMREGKYPAMPFNQQMSFPVELTLRTLGEGIRLCRKPVREIERLHEKTHTFTDQILTAGRHFIPETDCELFDVRTEIELDSTSSFGVEVRGISLDYDGRAQTIGFLGKTARLRPVNGLITLHLLIDRTSLEIFGNDGEISMSFCFLPEAADDNLVFYAKDGRVKLASLTIHELRSAWHE